MARGRLRIYLGAAPGVGKTVAMLDEGRRRLRPRHRRRRRLRRDPRPRAHRGDGRGARGRAPRAASSTGARRSTEMDLDAVLARRPSVALVDELAHTNAPGSRHEKRWQDIDDLLDAGIDVISTVNIQHLESLNDVVESITGVVQQETVPDEVVRCGRPDRAGRHVAGGAAPADGARQHLPGRAGRRRAGELLPGRQPVGAARAGPALAGRPGRRGRWTGTAPTTASTRPGRPASGSSSRSSGGPEGETLLRRGARIASRGAGGELLAVHVARADGLSGAAAARPRRAAPPHRGARRRRGTR